LQGAEGLVANNEMPEQPLEAGDSASAYDEGTRFSDVLTLVPCDRKKSRQGDRKFRRLARSRYRGQILRFASVSIDEAGKSAKINRELDGEDYDLNALVITSLTNAPTVSSPREFTRNACETSAM
jgi:hypothetical protein